MKVVLGSGTMGLSVAQAFAMGGYETTVYHRSQESVERSRGRLPEDLGFLKDQGLFEDSVEEVMGRIHLSCDKKEALGQADFIIECVPEDLKTKHEYFKMVDDYAPKEAFIGSNSSSIGFSPLLEGLPEDRHDKFLMCHWYNPGNIMPLVELSDYGNMADEDLDKIEQMFKDMGKVTIRAKKEVPGMVANRIQQGVAREVFWLMENEIASAEDIDKALTYGPAFRYATSGQLLIADMGGLDIWAVTGDNLLKDMDNRQDANPILREKVEEGKLGIKSGKGFFDYPEDEKTRIQQDYLKKLCTQLKTSKEYLED